MQERSKKARFGRDKMRLQRLDQQEGHSAEGDNSRDKIRHRVRQMLSDSPTEENRFIKGKGVFQKLLISCLKLHFKLYFFNMRSASITELNSQICKFIGKVW